MDRSDLLALLRLDPEKGIEAIIRAYGALAQKTVRQTGGDALSEEDREEIVSDVFYRVYVSRDRLDESKGTLASYVITLSRRCAIDRLRTKTRRGGEALPLEDAVLPSPEDAETAVLKKEARQRLVSAVIALGEPDATIVFRRFYFAQSYAEIGLKLGLTENAVTKRCRRALEKLRRSLREGE